MMRSVYPHDQVFGESGDDPTFTDMHDYVMHYLELFDALNLDRFNLVGLSFGGVPERLLVPFSAVKGFFDPSVQFGLQFDPQTAKEKDVAEPQPAPSTALAAAPSAAGGSDPGRSNGDGAEVVSLDAFRKKTT